MTHKLLIPLVITSILTQLNVLTKLISQNKSIEFDLSCLPDIDSSGIALLLELKQIAKQQKCILSITNLPSCVSDLCSLYKVTI